MYNNLVNKFVWGNLKNANYIDPETTRMITIIQKSFNQLTEDLLSKGRTEEARKTILKSLAVIPDRNYAFYSVLHRYYTADLLYKLKEVEGANKLAENTANYIAAELNYLADISQSKENLATSDIQLGLSVLNELIKITSENSQTALSNSLKNKFQALETKFMSNR
jgi:hypothetical protein